MAENQVGSYKLERFFFGATTAISVNAAFITFFHLFLQHKFPF